MKKILKMEGMLSLLFLPPSLIFNVLGRVTTNTTQRGRHITLTMFLDQSFSFYTLREFPYSSGQASKIQSVSKPEKLGKIKDFALCLAMDIAVDHDKYHFMECSAWSTGFSALWGEKGTRSNYPI